MNYTDRQVLTEDAPLTRGRVKGFSFKCYEDSGLKVTVICFTVLSIAITIALGLQLIYNDDDLQSRRHGAVATDYKDCSEIGASMLRKGGNAVDAAVAATICMAVVSPQKTGLGGGGFAMVYSHEDREKPVIIDFAKNTVKGEFGSKNLRVPALLRGLAVTHSLQGELPWEELVSPSSKLAREGFIVSKELAEQVQRDNKFMTIYGQLEAGQNLTLTKLSETLDVVARRGSNELYNGSLTQKILGIDAHDALLGQLASYQPEIKRAEVTNFYDHLVYYPPGTRALQNTLEKINALEIDRENASTTEAQLRIAKVLIDSSVQSKDTQEKFSSVVSMDGLDSYVVIITGLSSTFGYVILPEVGFLMDDSASNLENLTPVLFADSSSVCGLRGIMGSDDVTLTTELFYNLVVRRLNVSAAVENPRYYLLQDGISIEKDYPHAMDPKLQESLHRLLNPSKQNPDQLLKSCNAIVKIKDTMNSHSDSRGGGFASRF